MPARSVGTLLVQSSLGVCRYLENVDEVIVHVFLFMHSSVKDNKYIINMEIVIILVIVGGVIWAIVSGINGRQEVKELGEIMKVKVNNLSNFNATQKVVGVNNLYTFAVDNSFFCKM